MSEKKQATSTVVAKINNVEIVVVENGTKQVPIKPICEALGIDVDSQRKKLREDPILRSVTVLSTATGSDGKQYEMVSIPYMFVFGWLFRIDSRNVKEEAREAVEKYQVECYKALYNHFTRHAEFVEWQAALVEEQLVIVEVHQREFSEKKNVLIEAKEELKRRRQLSMADYLAEKAQLKIQFGEE